ncbi:DUF512 domain-containing protein [Neomoorella thermoacetica]|uniref:Radical SAM n=1 Tax=Moorella thermoacetica (strain ATCC 39073 / JCM 9320) TaxID=264732 RepID=Q2RJ40_MOOTA|nr:DUF512 domain-containing protein [Moorella thermoacetica]AKX94010.1 cyclic pyranopterin monophosphate synthase [Moorella thermoacetica]AKX96649.1 cyclic pyranopterin monophosphate synthase [Moorella thermoacetica]OIQ56378.1 cyclic pyranopterin monophosphate synthase [Moorella thermoacetica]OIQ57819.1 cyclic pyranopterin monophosphate synthase [Moorella thermoacetica]QDA00463.1 molybdenum cofactor biosynthesis protein A [Moorella thermoacetica]
MDNFHLALMTASRYNILPLTSTCNLGCLFCSHRQNPPGVETWRLQPLKGEEIDNLLDYLDGDRKIVIGESATRLIEGEPLTHPDFLAIIRKVRRRFPRARLEITTNGTLLTPNLIRELADLQPLEINLSLNSASPEGRRRLMGDRNPGAALQAPMALQQAGIIYQGSLVACPWLVGWDDFRETILYLARAGARTIRVFLPGYTRLAPPELRFPPGLRRQIEEELEQLRSLTDVPLLLEPPLLDNLLPEIEGAIPGTPAARAGLKRGDLILEIDGQKPRSRVEAYRWAAVPGRRRLLVGRHQGKNYGPAEIKLTGGQQVKNTRSSSELEGIRGALYELEVGREGSGLTFAWDFDPDLLPEVEKACRRHGARKVLILTSRLAVAVIKEAVARLSLSLEVVVTPSRFFGGSIGCAGLLTLADFQAAWQDWQKNNGPADLIILPSIAFDYRGRDLVGEHYLSLAASTGVPVELV